MSMDPHRAKVIVKGAYKTFLKRYAHPEIKIEGDKLYIKFENAWHHVTNNGVTYNYIWQDTIEWYMKYVINRI